MARLGERNGYYYVEYDDGVGTTDLMPRRTAYSYARMFGGGIVHQHKSAPWYHKLLWGGSRHVSPK